MPLVFVAALLVTALPGVLVTDRPADTGSHADASMYESCFALAGPLPEYFGMTGGQLFRNHTGCQVTELMSDNVQQFERRRTCHPL